jgi:plasmid stabilization system protein ParE
MPIRWTQPAADDLTHISDYTQEHFGPAQARRAALAIYEAADSLGKLPRRGRPGRKPNTRELAIPGLPFLIVYRAWDDVIEIARILHGSQRWP